MIIDGRKDVVLLFNDRNGFAHMYWYVDEHVMLFGPELKAFLAWEGFDSSVDDAAVASVLAQEVPFGTRTLFKQVTMMAPASKLVFSADGVDVSQCPRLITMCQPKKLLARD